MRKLALLIIFLAVLGGGYAFVQKRQAVDADTDTPTIELVEAELGSIRQQVDCTGRVEPALEVEIKSKASGEVVSIPFDISDPVMIGDLLVELDPVDEERKVKQSQAALLSSQASLKSARARARELKAKYDRVQALFEKDLASEEELEIAETGLVQAEASMEMAQAVVVRDELTLADAQQRLLETQIYSPIDGVISGRFIQIGQIISSGISNVGGGTTLISVADMSRLFVRASVAESDIGNVSVGQRSLITADAYPRERFLGSVVRVATKGENVSNVIVFDVYIEVVSPNLHLLKPEMTANVVIISASKEDALLIPLNAVFRRREGAFVTVRVGPGNDVEREVETGIDNGYMVEVLSGLESGDSVVMDSSRMQSRWRAGGEENRERRMRMMMSRMGGGGMRPR